MEEGGDRDATVSQVRTASSDAYKSEILPAHAFNLLAHCCPERPRLSHTCRTSAFSPLRPKKFLHAFCILRAATCSESTGRHTQIPPIDLFRVYDKIFDVDRGRLESAVVATSWCSFDKITEVHVILRPNPDPD